MKSKIDVNTIDIPESDYLFQAESQLPNSGTGLFTAVDIYKDEIVAYFDGEILSEKKARKRAEAGKDQYFISLLNGKIMDSRKVDCFAKYANDAKGMGGSSFKNNTRISLAENGGVCLIATKKIKANEEVFCGYGKRYWKKHGSLEQESIP